MRSNLKTIILFCIIFMGHVNAQVNFGSILQKAEDEGSKVAADKGPSLAKEAENKLTKKKSTDSAPKDSAALMAQSEAGLKLYATYDFVPGRTVVFEDHFSDDQTGEFPGQWDLVSGQAEIGVFREKAVAITSGSIGLVCPKVKVAKYLTDTFTLEFDYLLSHPADAPEAAPISVILKSKAGYDVTLTISKANVTYDDSHGIKLSNDIDASIAGDTFVNRWHHIALSCRGHQIKVYVDQFKTLVVPDTKTGYLSLALGGSGIKKSPVIFTNVRIASGGMMYPAGKKFTDAKLISHGIGFDNGHTTLRPESMGTLSMMVQIMKDNPDLKFEIGVHTDSDGDAVAGLTLSQQRAEAVRYRLIKMGIDGSRLTAKGYGMAKPVSDNDSPEGRANNRRIEFAKI